MNSHDEHKNGLLDFLTTDLAGPEREAVIRAFYEYAEGDPHSHPVGMATLLIACARKMAILPLAVRGNVNEMRHLSDEVTRLQKDLLEKLTQSNYLALTEIKNEGVRIVTDLKNESGRVLSVFKDGNVRVMETWRENLDDLRNLVNHVTDVHRQLEPIVTSARQIGQDFHTVQDGLKLNEESDGRTLQTVESLRLVHQESKTINRDTQELMKSLTKEARANWITIGYLVGIFLASLFYHLPWWGTWVSFGGILGLLQWLSRLNWKSKSKPTKENPTTPREPVSRPV
jgi:hypothetical protein